MLCVRAEDALAAAAAAAAASDKMRSVNLGGSIQRAVRRMAGGGGGGRKSGGLVRAASGDATASCSGGSEAASASDKLSARVPCSRGPDDEMSLSPSLFAECCLVACSAGAWMVSSCLCCILRLCSNGVLVSWLQDCFRWCLNPDGSSDLVFVFPLQDDTSTGSGKREGARRCSMRQYRSQLEQEVKKLQRQLQEEVDLHLALADAITYNAALILKSSIKLPDKAHELLISIASLEIAITKLEEDLNHLHYQLCQARNERLISENNPGCLVPAPSDCQASTACDFREEEHVSMLRDLGFSDYHSVEEDVSTEPEDKQDGEKDTQDREQVSLNRLLEKHQDVSLTGLLEHGNEEMQESCSIEKESKEDQKMDALPFSQSNLNKSSMRENVWNNPNQLSEEMVRSMKDIFLHLSASSKISPEATFANSSSSAERLSGSTLTSLSDSSVITSVMRSPSVDSHHDDGITDEVRNFDPYNVNGKEARRDIGSYCSVAEVSWMYIGNEQLEYASGALKKFRFLVEQLSKVDPTCMDCDERLAFWINLYNALIMHAYLAYGVPENDIKLFTLMQKACYTVGGQSVSAAEIEFVILKMKTPVHRPQLSLMLALHKFKTSEKLKKYSIDNTEPLVLFALCCGMFSSPAVRIFSAANIRRELQESMRDYIRASVGINDKGELIVPKLLQSYAKGIVEDSLLADWICRHLTLDQVAAIQDTSSSHKQRLLGVRSFSVIPFDSRFRYLFLYDNSRCQN